MTATAPVSPRSGKLDPAAAQALKQFVKKNRPQPPPRDCAYYTSEPAPERANSEVPTPPTKELAPAMRKFDIFDNIDEERVMEFDSLFEEARAASNYDAFKTKATKNASKFMTSSGVEVKDDGSRVLT